MMAIKAIVELHARRGKRSELIRVLGEIQIVRKDAPGFIGSELFEMIDDPEKLVEIVEWESREARQAWLEHSTELGLLNRLVGNLRQQFKAITVREMD